MRGHSSDDSDQGCHVFIRDTVDPESENRNVTVEMHHQQDGYEDYISSKEYTLTKADWLSISGRFNRLILGASRHHPSLRHDDNKRSAIKAALYHLHDENVYSASDEDPALFEQFKIGIMDFINESADQIIAGLIGGMRHYQTQDPTSQLTSTIHKGQIPTARNFGPSSSRPGYTGWDDGLPR